MKAEIKSKEQIYQKLLLESSVFTDRVFVGLFIFQWLLGIAISVLSTPQSWEGSEARIHPNVYLAVFFGFMISSFPIFLALRKPGHAWNRYVVAVAQMAYSLLLIHLTGGRIETHFHIFGSLAFLAFYQDPKPVLLATAFTAIDHIVRGFWWPQSVYGVLMASPWRAIEHAAWVVFEDVVLLLSIFRTRRNFLSISETQSKLEHTLNEVETIVSQRSEELRETQRRVLEQQESLSLSSKMSALGEMASGIAHEVNSPLSSISMWIEMTEKSLEKQQFDTKSFAENLNTTKITINRIIQIVRSLKSFARNDKMDPPQKIELFPMMQEVVGLCSNRFDKKTVRLDLIKPSQENLSIIVRPVELTQVLINLLNNSIDAIQGCSEKWIRLEAEDFKEYTEIKVTDSGLGIPADLQEKMHQAFFTTKEMGKGTGLGLHISRRIMENYGGSLMIDNHCKNTRFVLRFPKKPIQIDSK